MCLKKRYTVNQEHPHNDDENYMINEPSVKIFISFIGTSAHIVPQTKMEIEIDHRSKCKT